MKLSTYFFMVAFAIVGLYLLKGSKTYWNYGAALLLPLPILLPFYLIYDFFTREEEATNLRHIFLFATYIIFCLIFGALVHLK